jgi:hypothetical protein
VERRRRTAIIAERQDERARIAFARNEVTAPAAGIRYAMRCRLRELWDDGRPAISMVSSGAVLAIGN